MIFFGLLNASVNFQNCINKILTQKLTNLKIIYLDDIVIYTKE